MPQTDKWRVRCTTTSTNQYVYQKAGNPAPTQCPTDTAHTIDSTLTVLLEAAGKGETDDGARRVKIDPGTTSTDPKLYPHRWTSAGAVGDEWWDTSPDFGGKRIQGVIYQVENPVYGDELDVAFRSDGSNTAKYGPLDNVVQAFGPLNVPLGTGIQRDRIVFGTTKLIPDDGLKVSFKYHSSDTTAHKIAVDFVVHE